MWKQKNLDGEGKNNLVHSFCLEIENENPLEMLTAVPMQLHSISVSV